MADLGTIGASTSLGRRARSIAFPDVGAVDAATRTLGQKSGQVPTFWSLVQGRVRSLGTKSFTGGTTVLRYGVARLYNNRALQVPNAPSVISGAARSFSGRIAFTAAGMNVPIRGYNKSLTSRALQVPNLFTLVRGTTRQANYVGSVVPFTPTVISATARTFSGRIAFPAYGWGNLIRGRDYRALAAAGSTVPTYWTGPSRGRRTVDAQDAVLIDAPLSGVAAKPYAYVSTKVPSYWTGSVTGEWVPPLASRAVTINTVQSGSPKGIDDTFEGTLAVRAGQAVAGPLRGVQVARAVRSFPAGAVETGPYTAIWTGYGLPAAYNQYSTITMYMRDSGTVNYGVQFDLGASDTLVRVTVNDVPQDGGLYIGPLLGTHTIRGQIYGRTIFISADGQLKYTYTDSRTAGPDVADAAGKVGFKASNVCIDTFTADLAPAPYVFVEDFESGFGAYTSVSGNTSIYSIATGMNGHYMRCMPQNSGVVARIDRVLPSVVSATTISIRFRLNSTNSDDAATLSLVNTTTGLTAFRLNPRREGFYDSARRPQVGSSAGTGFNGTLYIGSTGLVDGVEYVCQVLASTTPGLSSITIRNFATNAIVSQYFHSSAVAPLTFDRIAFVTDTGGLTCETHYDDITAY